MEINSAIVGAKLNEIQKKADEVKLFLNILQRIKYMS